VLALLHRRGGGYPTVGMISLATGAPATATTASPTNYMVAGGTLRQS